ncbi:putative mitogen-activated protein kinase kinase kinase STE-STE11 family [Dioscorea sansibarensis]
MPWWKPSSSPSSSSSSPRSTSSPQSVRRDPASSFFGRRSEPLPRLTRQRKLRHLPDSEIGGVFSTPVSRTASGLNFSPARSVSSPVPLPLPRSLAASPQRDLVVGFGCPLPSPKEPSGRADVGECNGPSESSPVVESNGDRLFPTNVTGSRLNQSNTQKKTEVSTTSAGSASGKISKDANFVGAANFKIPAKSAPTSGLSSPVVSPRRSFNIELFPSAPTTSQGPLTWPQLDIPPPDFSAILSPQTSPEKTVLSPDCSPLYSPSIRSPVLRSRNPSAPPSPLHPKFADNCNGRLDCVTVHPLPLPPGAPATAPQQPGFPHQTPPRIETAPMANQWQKTRLIGSGTFGNVYVATNRETGALCAMKEVNIIPDDAKSAECLKQLEQEIKVLSQLKHQNIVQYYGSELTNDCFYIYLEYVHPGSINKYVRDHCGAMTESVVRNFTRHILNGLAYLHSKNTMHRDIKGANLLVDAHGVVKLADFGMAKHLSGATANLSMKGTPYWMAPEVMQATMNKEVGYDLAVDIWSLGCTIIEMFTGKPPWSGLEGPAAMFKVLHKDPPVPETLSPEGKDFLRLCFRRNPADRPTASNLLDHPFITNTHHHNLHGSIQAFSSMKLDNAYSPREKPKSRSESSLKGKQLSHGDTILSPESSESAASRFHCSVPELSPSIVHSNPFTPNYTSGQPSPSGNPHPWVLPKPPGNEG